MPLLSEARLLRLVSQILEAAGLTADEARICADAATFADLRGTSTHGIVYIVPETLDTIAAGRAIAGTTPQVANESPAIARLRGVGVAGPVLATRAMEIAVAKATSLGIGAVNTSNGCPIGMLGYYANLAAEQGLVGLVMANTAPAAAPFGAASAVLGTNPMAYAVPAAKSRPLVFDIATTVVAAGKLARAKRLGEAIPAGWLIDADGRTVTDPAGVANAVMLPFGGHKGSGIGLLIHLLTGALAGSTIGGEPTHRHPDPDKRGQSALYLAIDPAWFGSRETFEEMVERQIDAVHAAKPMPGFGHPLYPGERGWSEFDRRRRDGIPIPPEDFDTVVSAVRAGGLDADRLFGDILTGGTAAPRPQRQSHAP